MLEQISESMWYAEHDLFLVGGIHFRGRMTVVRLSDGSLWLHSPIPIDDELASEIADLGDVKHIVAPCLFHHLHFKKCAERYTGARKYGVPGFDKKRPDIKFDEFLSGVAPTSWCGDIEQRLIEGVPKLNEVVFFHKSTKTLIVTDLVFHIYEVKNWISRVVFRMVGAYQKLSQSRLIRSVTKDRNAAKASVQKMLEWDFQRLVMAHGRIVEEDAKARTAKALHWMLK